MLEAILAVGYCVNSNEATQLSWKPKENTKNTEWYKTGNMKVILIKR